MCGLYPEDPIKAALVDSFIDEEVDLFMGLSVSIYKERFGFGCLTDELVTGVRKMLNDEVLPKHLSFFERILGESTTGWLAGTPNPTIADFVLVPRLQWLSSGVHNGIGSDILDQFPRVQQLIEKLMQLEAIVTYYSK